MSEKALPFAFFLFLLPANAFAIFACTLVIAVKGWFRLLHTAGTEIFAFRCFFLLGAAQERITVRFLFFLFAACILYPRALEECAVVAHIAS